MELRANAAFFWLMKCQAGEVHAFCKKCHGSQQCAAASFQAHQVVLRNMNCALLAMSRSLSSPRLALAALEQRRKPKTLASAEPTPESGPQAWA